MTSDNDLTPQINYELLVETALRSVVRSALMIVAQSGFEGDSHFYITFLTDHPGVNISKQLKENHPEKLTIILQHQFWDLNIEDDQFSVSLSFDGKREILVVPFMAIIDFNDPAIGFGLQFDLEHIDDKEAHPEDNEQDKDAPAASSADVVSLDTFRKKT